MSAPERPSWGPTSPATQPGTSANKPTTAPAKKSPCKELLSRCYNQFCSCCRPRPGYTTAHLGPIRFLIKAFQLWLSAVALTLQALLGDSAQPLGRVFFRFVCCFAVILSIVVLALYCTPLYARVTEDQVKMLDFWFVALAGTLFPVASYLLSETQEGREDKNATIMLGLLAGVAFFEDALMVCCSPWHAKRTQEGYTTGPLNPAVSQPSRYQPV